MSDTSKKAMEFVLSSRNQGHKKTLRQKNISKKLFSEIEAKAGPTK